MHVSRRRREDYQFTKAAAILAGRADERPLEIDATLPISTFGTQIDLGFELGSPACGRFLPASEDNSDRALSCT